MSTATRRHDAREPAEVCTDCGCELAPAESIHYRGDGYCLECGYAVIERVKASHERFMM